MHLYITGFLSEDHEDDSLKYDLDVAPEFEQAVMDVLGWKSLAEESDGELPLTHHQILQIASVIKEPLPSDLDLFIGVVRD
ncbi:MULTISPECIES: pyocin S6 family toxin immunity protein [unclassified Pseudomonas]|uniref:pyocin S6 family toxin immunity protein n=1 Tax=unclassified Pseudomonas TaxID=196821 RepID=UPI000C2FE8E2|nr:MULTISPECIES: pyocin S6 family toxin immunity protein [unclassified Pseudomonas]MCU1740714.1 pyocin S6 family toxin immunity protein [Pseudomonas sp. 20S_6.2_Bac1]